MTKSQCLLMILLFYGGAIFAVFVRAFVRRRLLEDCEALHGAHRLGESDSWPKKILLAVPRQSLALRDLRKSISGAPDAVQRRFGRFQILTWVALILIALLIVFSFVAHDACEP